MKDLKEIKDISKNIKNDEKTTSIDINVTEFDPTIANLEFVEDLTEKVISYLEKEVRGSYEYQSYIKYLKDELDLTKCSLLPGIDQKEDSVSLEFHHYPLNLYEITEAVATSLLSDLEEGESISCFDISEKVVEEHYKNNVGLVPLTTTLHKMAHNRSIIIPISKVNGNYKNFIKKYKESIPEDIQERIIEAEINSESDDAKLYNQTKLEKNITHYNVEYFRELNNDKEEDTDE